MMQALSLTVFGIAQWTWQPQWKSLYQDL